ncbi:MAG: helix-turn-helix domain-containing protein [Ruminiclostridium sp.]
MLHKNQPFYRPLIAKPFIKTRVFREVPPTAELRPYIRCFWGGEAAAAQEIKGGEPDLIIPDTCADLIFRINETTGKVSCGFAGISDCCGYSHFSGNTSDRFSTFAIRFYGWAVYRFSQDSMSGTLNNCFNGEEIFGRLCVQLCRRLPELRFFEERIGFAEKLLVSELAVSRQDRLFDRAVLTAMDNYGALDISALAKEVFVSTRQLERIFRERAGTSPKKLSGLIRYQLLWQEIVMNKGFDLQDAVLKYGFTDEAHLMREFRRYHGMNIRDARAFAAVNVANLQDI